MHTYGPDALAPLLQRMATDVHSAFPAFHDATASQVYRMAFSIVQSAELAADVSQDVYLEVWRLANTFDPERGRAMGWLMTMTRRRAIDAYRSHMSSTARDWRIGIRDLDDNTPDVGDAVIAQVQRDDAHHRIKFALEGLTFTKRQVVRMAYFQHMTRAQIAAELAIPISTVKTRLRDGLQELRKALTPSPTTETPSQDSCGRPTSRTPSG